MMLFHTVALAAIVLGQHLSQASICTYSSEGPPSVVQGVSQDTISNLKTLLEGLQTQSQLVRKMLPKATEHIHYFNMMKSLTALSEHEERLRALITLTGAHNDPELAAMQVVFKNLVANTCSLFKQVYSLENCSPEVIKELQVKIETFDIAEKSSTAVRSSLNALTGGKASSRDYKKWIANISMCTLSDEEIALVNQAQWPYLPFNKDCCQSNNNPRKPAAPENIKCLVSS